MSGGSILNADMTTVRAWLGTGLRWWLGELAGIVPPRWRQARIGRLARYAYDPARGRLDPLPTDRGHPPGSDAAISVILPPTLTLIRAIDYPAVGERDLAAMVELDRDRIMPQGDALIGTRVLARDPVNRRMQVEVAGLPLASAAELARTLARETTREPAQILASAPEPQGLPPIDLLPALRRAGLIGTADRPAAPLWLAVGFLFLLNIGALVWRDSAATDNLSAMVDQQQPAVGVAHRIIARIHGGDRIARQAIAARRDREPVALLARIDAALPPGTWVQRFNWQGDTVQVAGYRPPRSDVSGALRRAGLKVTRYGDSADEAASPQGQAFEATIDLGRR